MREDEELVVAARSGEPDAFGPLAARWFDRCWEIAWRILHDRDLAADVAQDTLLTAWQRLDRLERPESFGGWVSRIARNRALDRLERERRAVPTGDHDMLEPGASTAASLADPEAEFDRVRQHDLVWAAAAALGERDASILDLHLRHGLEPAELAEELGVTPNNAHQLLFRLRKRLGGAIRAWIVWHGGKPNCVVLRAELAAAGATEFGREVVRLVDAHVATCEVCEEERARVTAPAAMFSAVPLVMAPAGLRDQVMAALAAAGVPVGDAGQAASVAQGDPGGTDASAGSDAAPGEPVSGQEGAAASPADDAGKTAATSVTVDAAAESSGPEDGAGLPEAADLTETAGPPWGKLAAAAGLVLLAAVAIWAFTDQLAAPVVVDELTAFPLEPATEAEEPIVVDLPPPGDMHAAPPADDEAPPAPPADDAVTPPPAPPEPSPEPTPPATGDPGPGDDAPDPGDPDPEESDEPDDPAPPVIDEFSATAVRGVRCPVTGEVGYAVRWRTDGADTVTLEPQGSDRDGPDVGPEGDETRCAPRGTTFVLTATNEGGTVTEEATAIAPAG